MPMVIYIVKVQIQREPQLSGLADLLAVEVHPMAARRKVANALQSNVVLNPQLLKGWRLDLQPKQQGADVFCKRSGVVQAAAHAPAHSLSRLSIARVGVANIPCV
nr:hypothetical protein [Acidovorax sp.]